MYALRTNQILLAWLVLFAGPVGSSRSANPYPVPAEYAGEANRPKALARIRELDAHLAWLKAAKANESSEGFTTSRYDDDIRHAFKEIKTLAFGVFYSNSDMTNLVLTIRDPEVFGLSPGPMPPSLQLVGEQAEAATWEERLRNPMQLISENTPLQFTILVMVGVILYKLSTRLASSYRTVE